MLDQVRIRTPILRAHISLPFVWVAELLLSYCSEVGTLSSFLKKYFSAFALINSRAIKFWEFECPSSKVLRVFPHRKLNNSTRPLKLFPIFRCSLDMIIWSDVGWWVALGGYAIHSWKYLLVDPISANWDCFATGKVCVLYGFDISIRYVPPLWTCTI